MLVRALQGVVLLHVLDEFIVHIDQGRDRPCLGFDRWVNQLVVLHFLQDLSVHVHYWGGGRPAVLLGKVVTLSLEDVLGARPRLALRTL